MHHLPVFFPPLPSHLCSFPTFFQTRETREVIDLAGFEEVSLMDTDECSVPHSFKVNTSRNHYYFHAESKNDKAKWVECILGMMSAIQSADHVEGELTRSGSLKSVKSVRTATFGSNVPITPIRT